ncbi:MAG: galactose-1-phosphate uridylyltransferase [Kosmotogaceae bacterium]
MLELRLNPLTGEWVIISSGRSSRPVLPENACPLCPGVLEVEKDYDLVVFDNRFPSLTLNPPHPSEEKNNLMKERALGKCEVIMYTSKHDLSVSDMSENQLHKLVEVWCNRYNELSKIPDIKYIYIFENRGKEVGATLSHAHGQLYAFSYIPPRVERKVQQLRGYYYENGRCSLCKLIEDLNEDIIIRENESFFSFVPSYARFPYEVHIYPKRHVSSITDLTGVEKRHLGNLILDTVRRYDNLFEEDFPYMMMLFNAPVNTEELYDEWFHFHIEFCPPKRSKDKIKWMASVETGSWNFINPADPENIAKQLKETEVD